MSVQVTDKMNATLKADATLRTLLGVNDDGDVRLFPEFTDPISKDKITETLMGFLVYAEEDEDTFDGPSQSDLRLNQIADMTEAVAIVAISPYKCRQVRDRIRDIILGIATITTTGFKVEIAKWGGTSGKVEQIADKFFGLTVFIRFKQINRLADDLEFTHIT